MVLQDIRIYFEQLLVCPSIPAEWGLHPGRVKMKDSAPPGPRFSLPGTLTSQTYCQAEVLRQATSYEKQI